MINQKEKEYTPRKKKVWIIGNYTQVRKEVTRVLKVLVHQLCSRCRRQQLQTEALQLQREDALKEVIIKMSTAFIPLFKI